MGEEAAPKSGAELYRLGIERADAELEGQLVAIRAAEDARHISVREAADKRIVAMENHLAECRRLREAYLN